MIIKWGGIVSLSKLEIAGFKSFMNPVTLEFRDQITAILGPNGCGKSNIVDSVRWVLGEQSAKMLRGIKMENVIFNGTEEHKPLGFAQVSLTLNNEKGLFPLDYSEITITRKVYRSGISEYFINKSPCRLKDIRELFADTGTGSNSYAIIDQEIIDFVLNDTHGERKLMFEEAAGIVKYRMRREEAQRKLKLTETDLVRLEDIIEELDRQVRSLRYQVGKAKRYSKIKERLKVWGIVLMRKQLSALLAEKRGIESELDTVLEKTEREDFSLGESESLLQRKRDDLGRLESGYNELQNKRYEIRSRIQSSEEKVIQLNERKSEASRRIERARQEIEEANNRLANLAERIAAIEADRSGIEARLEERKAAMADVSEEYKEVSERVSVLKEELLKVKQTQLDFIQDKLRIKNSLEHFNETLTQIEDKVRGVREDILVLEQETNRLKSTKESYEEDVSRVRSELEEAERKREKVVSRIKSTEEGIAAKSILLASKKEEAAKVRSRYELLKGMVENLEGYSTGTRLLVKKDSVRFRGPLADLIVVDEKYKAALLAVLHDKLDSVLVNGMDEAFDAIREIVGHEVGATKMLFAGGARSIEDTDVLGHPGCIGRLSDFVSMKQDEGGLIHALIGNVLLFEDLDSAMRFVQSGGNGGFDAVTLNGVYIEDGKGVTYSGNRDEDITLIGRVEAVEKLEEKTQRLTEELSLIEGEYQSLLDEKSVLTDELVTLEGKIVSLRRELADKLSLLQEAERDYIMKREKASLLMNSLDEMEGSRAELLAKIEETRMTLEMQEGSSNMPQIGDLESEFSSLQGRKEELEARLTEMKIEIASLKGDYEKKEDEVRVVREMRAQYEELVTQREREIEEAEKEMRELDEGMAVERENVRSFDEEESKCKGELDDLYAALEERRREITDIEKKIKEKQQERERIFARRNEIDVKLSTIDTRMRDIIEKARELYEEDLSCYLGGLEIPLSEDEIGVDEEALAREKRKLESLGPVNLAAIEEYEEKKERLDFLLSQKDDLVRAKEELNEAIRKINKRARKQFLEMFEIVKKNFAETFQVLFEGGEADLSLSEGIDPLEADVVISARPKGKKLQDISLLSGGERTLTALALLFALYKAKPSPFCIFDEVDAPLDEANVQRFVKMLERFKEDTQFIIITHNKRTMEIASTLYGVTMEEKGVSKIVSVDLTNVENVLKTNKTPARRLINSTVSSN